MSLAHYIQSSVMTFKARPHTRRYHKNANYLELWWKIKTAALIHSYGITMDDVMQMWNDQGQRCAVCRRRIGLDIPHVDHCHKSGEVRGIVHGYCNTLIGYLEAMGRVDDRLLRRIAKYLKIN